MSASDVLTKLRSLGVRAEPRADRGVALIPASLVPPELLAEAKAHRNELAALLDHPLREADTADTNFQGAEVAGVADTADAADTNFQGAGVASTASTAGADTADANFQDREAASTADTADANPFNWETCSKPAAEREPPGESAAREWPPGMNEPGLSPYTIRDLANWYEEEANRRRDGLELDQAALDRDLRARLADRGVFREFISVEFERVMQAVFAVESA